MALPDPPARAAPQVTGVYDFALRKGQVHGTVIADAESGGVADLLPDRQAGTLEAWLTAHPGAEVICRDRAGAYAGGARAARRARPRSPASLSNFLCKPGQSLSFCYITVDSFRCPGQTGTRLGNVTANAFMAAFQPRVPVPRCPLSRTSPSPSMWRPVTFLIPR